MNAGIIALLFLSGTPLFSADSTHTSKTLDKKYHFNVGYGRSRFNPRSGVLLAYRDSGYPYTVVSTSDASPTVSLPIALTLGMDYSLTEALRIGLSYAYFAEHDIQGSNWIGGDWRNAPKERFDVIEKTSGQGFTAYLDFVFLPVNHGENRWEGSLGAGVSINQQKMTGLQSFNYCPTFSICTLDSNQTYGSKKIVPGAQLHAALDFYWTRWLSTQARLEVHLMPALKVPEQTLTYGTLRSAQPFGPAHYVVDTHVLRRHAINFSGTTFSLWFRFHL